VDEVKLNAASALWELEDSSSWDPDPGVEAGQLGELGIVINSGDVPENSMSGDLPAGDGVGVGGANAADIGAGLNGVRGRNKNEAGDFDGVDAAESNLNLLGHGVGVGVEDFIGVEYWEDNVVICSWWEMDSSLEDGGLELDAIDKLQNLNSELWTLIWYDRGALQPINWTMNSDMIGCFSAFFFFPQL